MIYLMCGHLTTSLTDRYVTSCASHIVCTYIVDDLDVHTCKIAFPYANVSLCKENPRLSRTSLLSSIEEGTVRALKAYHPV